MQPLKIKAQKSPGGSDLGEEPQQLDAHPGSRPAFAEKGDLAGLGAKAPAALCLSTTV